RWMRVFVLGGVRRPGSHPVSALSRVSDAIRAAGGLSVGSMRNVKLIGTDGEEKTLDLFHFYFTGDLSANPYLKVWQTIFVPLERKTVSIGGDVSRPGRYEILEGETVDDLIRMAGGALPDADLEDAWLKRFNRDGYYEIIKLNLKEKTGAGQPPGEILLQPDDVLTVHSLKRKADYVTVEGRVAAPGKYLLHENMTAYDVITEAGGVLLNVSRIMTGQGADGETQGPADVYNAYILRADAGGDGETRAIPLNLYALIVEKNMEHDVVLEPNDRVVVPAAHTMISVQGMVARPGMYGYVPNRTVSDYLELAGTVSGADVVGVSIARLDGSVLKGRETIVEPGDRLFIPRKKIAKWTGYFRMIASILTTALGIERLYED
ncbi:MAG: SLBB domain-containing protein, partial [bacterium]